jgi:hypothetical protein
MQLAFASAHQFFNSIHRKMSITAAKGATLLACCLDVDRCYFTVLSCLFTHCLVNVIPNLYKCYMSTVVVRKDLLHENQCPAARSLTNDARVCYPRILDLYVDYCCSRPNIQNVCDTAWLYKHLEIYTTTFREPIWHACWLSFLCSHLHLAFSRLLLRLLSIVQNMLVCP